ncbi:MAG: hypothetical protein ACKVQV_10440 [Bacteroidia bacterium]
MTTYSTHSIRKNWKLLFLLLISGVIIPYSTPISKACGGWDDPDFTEILMFNPEIIDMPNQSPFFLSINDYYQYSDYDRENSSNGINNQEWLEYTQHSISFDTLNWLIYKSSIEEIKIITKDVNENNPNILLKHPSLSSFIKLKYAKEITNYLLAAKITENHCQSNLYSWEPVERDTISIYKHIQDLLLERKKVKSKFLKQRYDFQILRSYLILGNNEQGIKYYQQNAKKNKNIGSMYYRCLGYYAALLYRENRYAESNLIYAQIYDQYEPQRSDAYSSFHPLEESDWQQTLHLAKNKREKEVLWQLYGFYSNPLIGLQEIIKINPTSDLLDLLLVRSVNIAESNCLNNYPDYINEEYNSNYNSSIDGNPINTWATIQKNQLDSVATIIDKQLSNSNFNRKKVWATAGAFINYLQGNYASASKLATQYDDINEDVIHGQNLITQLLVQVAEAKKSLLIDENELFEKLDKLSNLKSKNVRVENCERFVFRQLTEIYAEKFEVYKSVLCNRNPNEDLSEMQQLDELITFMESSNKSNLENYFVSTYPLNLEQLYEIKGIYSLYQYKFQEADNYFEKSTVSTEGTYGDPFNIKITDCHDCDHAESNATRYSRLDFTKKLIALQTNAKNETNVEKKSRIYFEYANGLYNMSYHGNARSLQGGPYPFDMSDNLGIRFYTYENDREQNENSSTPRNISLFNDCHEAMKWYNAAKSLTKDVEFAAQCAWMSAKCEHNIWLEEYYNGTNDFIAERNFELLKNEYQDTKYFQQIISECGYFCTYINGPDKNCIRNK